MVRQVQTFMHISQLKILFLKEQNIFMEEN